MADLRSRYPHWRVDFVDLNGPLARIDKGQCHIELDWAHLEEDQDMTVTYVVSLLDVSPVWPPSSTCRQRAKQMALKRLSRFPHFDDCERSSSASDTNMAR